LNEREAPRLLGPRAAALDPQRKDDGEPVGERDEREQRAGARRDRLIARPRQLGDERGDEQQRHHPDAKQHQVGEPLLAFVHPALMLPAISKMGRYIAMISPPTMPPKNTIISGSIILVI